jgi:hypothetical protein
VVHSTGKTEGHRVDGLFFLFFAEHLPIEYVSGTRRRRVEAKERLPPLPDDDGGGTGP